MNQSALKAQFRKVSQVALFNSKHLEIKCLLNEGNFKAGRRREGVQEGSEQMIPEC